MTNEEKTAICKLLWKETGCGLMTVSKALDKLIEALKKQPPIVMDNPNCLTITWENGMARQKKEKEILYKPKPWAMYCNGDFVRSFPSHKAAKRALHYKCMEMEKYPYDYADEYYTIKPYNK